MTYCLKLKYLFSIREGIEREICRAYLIMIDTKSSYNEYRDSYKYRDPIKKTDKKKKKIYLLSSA